MGTFLIISLVLVVIYLVHRLSYKTGYMHGYDRGKIDTLDMKLPDLSDITGKLSNDLYKSYVNGYNKGLDSAKYQKTTEQETKKKI